MTHGTHRVSRALRVLAVLATITLSACGTRFLPPAATVDGRQISQEELKATLDVALSDPQVAQQVGGPRGNEAKADLTRRALGSLIQREIAAEYADAHGIVVTEADIDQQLAATVTQVGGQQQFDDLIKARGLSMAAVRVLLRDQVLFTKVQDAVVAALPSPPSDPQGRGQAFQRWLTDRVARADVIVNPRFGRFDHQTGEVVALTSTADLG
jgi:co-chaperonin GroES (HSP10)